MKYIYPHTRKENIPAAIVDDDNYDYLNGFKWNITAKKGTTNYYYHTRINNKWVKMHRLILGIVSNLVCDHINHITTDNRKSNIRLVDKRVNDLNRQKCFGASVYKGVTKHKKRWRVRINRKHIGLFLTEKEAAIAYNTKAKELLGDDVYLNNIS